MSSDIIQQHADALGMSKQDYMSLASTYAPPASGSGMANQQNYGGQITQPSDADVFAAVQQQVNNQKLLNKAAGGSSSSTTNAAPKTVAQNPLNDITNLGAAALGEQAVYNAVPGLADPKSGIGTVTQPQITANKAYAPQGPWSSLPGVFGKTGVPQGAGQPPSGSTALDTIGSKMTPDQFSDVANQIRGGATNYVTVDGKPYTLSADNINKITTAFPGSQPQQQSPFAQVPPTQPRPITPIAPPTAAAVSTPTATPPSTQFQTPSIQSPLTNPMMAAAAQAAYGQPQGMPQGMPGQPQGQPGQMSFGDMVAHSAIQNEIARQTQASRQPATTAPGPNDMKKG